MLSLPIFMLWNIKIFIKSKNTGGICRQNMHLSTESAWKWDTVLDQWRLFWHTKEKFRKKKQSWVFLIFLKCVKIASVGLRLDRPQPQHWLLFQEHNWPTPKSENSNVVGLPVPQPGLYLWAMTVFVLQLASPPVLLILCDTCSSSSFSRIQKAQALVDLKRHSYNNQTNI